MSIQFGGIIRLQFALNQTDLLAPTAKELIAPEDGFILGLSTSVQVAITTGGTIAVKRTVTTALDTTVSSAALTQTIANSATKGTIQNTASIVGDSTRAVKKGDRIAIVPASFATAGAIEGYITLGSVDA